MNNCIKMLLNLTLKSLSRSEVLQGELNREGSRKKPFVSDRQHDPYALDFEGVRNILKKANSVPFQKFLAKIRKIK